MWPPKQSPHIGQRTRCPRCRHVASGSANKQNFIMPYLIIIVALILAGCADHHANPGTARAASIAITAQAEATQDAATKAGADAAAKEGAADAAERASAPDAAKLRGDAIVARKVADELDRRAAELAKVAEAKSKAAEAEDRARETARADQAKRDRAWWIGMGGVILGGLVGVILGRLTTIREGILAGGAIAGVGVLAAGYGAVSPWVFALLFLAALVGAGFLLRRQAAAAALTASLSRAVDAGEAARVQQQPIHLERALADLGSAVDHLPGARQRLKHLRAAWRTTMGLNQELTP